MFDNVFNVRPCKLAPMLETCVYAVHLLAASPANSSLYVVFFSHYQSTEFELAKLVDNTLQYQSTLSQHVRKLVLCSAWVFALSALRHRKLAIPDCADCHDAHRHRVLNVQKTCI